MAKYCAIIPTVLNKSNEKVDSKLFKDLLSLFHGDNVKAAEYYLKTKNPKFKSLFKNIRLDDNNEPMLVDLIETTNFGTIVTDNQIIQMLEKDLSGLEGAELTPQSYSEFGYSQLLDVAETFNKQNNFETSFYAKPVRETDINGKTTMQLRIVKNDLPSNVDPIQVLRANHNLNKQLRKILGAAGISIGSINALEKRLGINGVTDFSMSNTIVNGTVELIRILNGEQGEKVLPEEFSHFAIESLGDSALVSSIVNNIVKNDFSKILLEEDYNTYYDLYNGDAYKLAKEAAGKLLAHHLLQTQSMLDKKETPTLITLLKRIVTSLKNLFNKVDTIALKREMYRLNSQIGTLSLDLLTGTAAQDLTLSKISSSDMYYNIQDRLQRSSKVLDNIIKTESKRFKIYAKHGGDDKFGKAQTTRLDNLRSRADNNEVYQGIFDYLKHSLDVLQQLETRLNNIDGKATLLNERASVLRDIRNYMFSYKSITNEIRKDILSERNYEDSRYSEVALQTINDITVLLENLELVYKEKALPLLSEFLRPFLGDGMVIPYGINKGKIMDIDSVLKRADRDITITDRWLDSMADSSDIVLQLFDAAVKKSKEMARMRIIDTVKNIQAKALTLEKAGIKNTDWMFEYDESGNITTNYITEIHWSKYKRVLREFYLSLEEKYGKNPTGKDAQNYREDLENWYKNNTYYSTDKKGNVPKKSLYGNAAYDQIMNENGPRKAYYNAMMEIKRELGNYLPSGVTYANSAVLIRKDFLERMKSSTSIGNSAKQLWEVIKESLVLTSKDVEYSEQIALLDFEGNTVDTLPLYYTSLRKNETMEDMSTDVSSAMIAFASMAINYDEMNNVIDVLELGRGLMMDREVVQTSGKKVLKEKFKLNGVEVENEVIVKGLGTKFMQRLNDFFDMQIYNKMIKNQGTIGETNISVAKAADTLNLMTSIKGLSFNVLSSLATLSVGSITMRIESLVNEYFSPKNVAVADVRYAANIPGMLSEIGNRVKTNKLALWIELFDVGQDYEHSLKNIQMNRKTWLGRMLNLKTLFFMNNAGEHWLATRTSLAMANRYKMKDSTGKIVDLWDAVEPVYIDPMNKALGAKLQVKEGYTKEDGTDFTKADLFAFRKKVDAINQGMHGIYNSADKAAIHKGALGRIGMLYRKWMKPSINKRFAPENTNLMLGTNREGYWRSTGKFVWEIIKDLSKAKMAIGVHWKNMTDHQRKNIFRSIIDAGQLLLVIAALQFIDWEDEEDKWIIRMIEYQLRRVYTEIGALVPGQSMLTESLRLLKEPSAAVNTIEDIINLGKLMFPSNYEEVLQTGKYKGKTKAFKYIMESPFILFTNNIDKALHPEYLLPYYNLE